jgi:hypothetical protein
MIRVLIFLLFIYSIASVRFIPIAEEDIRINLDTKIDNMRGGVAVLNNSNFIIVWEAGNTVLAQTYDMSTDERKGGAVKIPSDAILHAMQPYIVNLGKVNRYVITYQDFTNVQVLFKIFDYENKLVKEGIASTYLNDYADCDLWPKVASNLNGDFVITWNMSNRNWGWIVRARIYNSEGIPITGDIQINGNNNTDESQAMPCSLTNGNFVITYHSKASGTHQVYFIIYAPNGIPIGERTIGNLNPGVQSWIPHCKGLSNGGFVLSYETFRITNTADVVFRLFDANGNALDNYEHRVNATPTFGMTWSTITTLPVGFVVAYYGADTDAYLRVFSDDGHTIYPETRIHTITAGKQTFPVLASYDNGFIVTWQGDDTLKNNKYYQIFDYDQSECFDYANYVGKGQKTQLHFPTGLGKEEVRIFALPTSGTLDNGNDALDSVQLYSSKSLYIKTDKPTIFEYVSDANDSPCKFNIQLCYESCKTCTGSGDKYDHNCSSCADNYFPLEGQDQCFKSSDSVHGHYFESSSSTFVKCYKGCYSCSGVADFTNHKCTKCEAGYYSVEEFPGQCYSPTDIVPGYTFVNDSFEKCTIGCSSLKYILIIGFVIIFIVLLIV